MTHGFFPFWLKIDKFPPHPYPWENHAPFDLVAATVAGCVQFLIIDAYLHDAKNLICVACPDTPSVTNSNPKHSITDQWWGLGR